MITAKFSSVQSFSLNILEPDMISFLIQNNLKGGCNSLNEDTLGSLVKSGMAQYIALEITRGNGSDNRAIARYLPWLYHPPSTTQQG